ncbi:PREDICTED: cytochrome P450 CYP12A2-like [Papilio polytes]|uniref:cytochrome P450 CYP12A2-like n=1 Tax=Papilio polytes TaxID=76194 RepID=UPI0006760D98|nr:PREDICTED: cytochrome P450 CYP12A2-like [Papilio polytes]
MKTTKTGILKPFLKLTDNVFKNVKFISTVNVTAEVTKGTRTLKSWDEIPGPSTLPILSSLHHFLPGGFLHKLSGYELMDKLYKTYGPIVKLPGLFGSQTNVILFDAESVANVLRNENFLPKRPGFESLEHFRKIYKKNNGEITHEITGLGSDHGEQWKTLRSTVNPIMNQPKTIKMYADTIDEVARDMVERIRSIRDERGILSSDFSEEMKLWSMESIAVVALGSRLNCFDPNLPADSPVKKLIQNAHDCFATVDKLDVSPNLWRWYATPFYKKAMKMFQELEDLNKYFIQEAIKRLEKERKTDKEKGILEKLLEINEHFAHLMASDMLFAGADTTSNSVVSILYLLAKNPQKQRKLREELLSGSEKQSYLKACVKEGMRIMPVASGNVRETTKEYNILGYHIPKQKKILFAHEYTSKMDCHYPRPNEYIPERWLADKEDPLYYGNAHPFAFSPFGFGSRSCIGRRIAELEIESIVARVVQNFDIQWFGEPMKLHHSTLNYVKGPFSFIFKDV